MDSKIQRDIVLSTLYMLLSILILISLLTDSPDTSQSCSADNACDGHAPEAHPETGMVPAHQFRGRLR
jgi:hypothetical protein